MSATAKQLTPEQQQAIQTRKVSVALSAGAGCGKTFVLTERFLSHVSPNQQDGLDPDKLHEIVAITFTDAAAREMRSRIRHTCLARLQTAPAEEVDWWLRLMRAMESARVSTIHAFCTALLRTHAVDAGLDPLFEVMDQSEADVLLSEIIDDVLREKLADKDDATIDLAATFDLARLKEMIRGVVPTIRNADVERWLVMDGDELLKLWQDRLAEDYPRLVKSRLAEGPQVAQIQELLGQLGSISKATFADAAAELNELLPRLKTIENVSDPSSLIERIREAAKVGGICSAKDWPTKEQFDEYKVACKELRDLIDKLPAPFDAEAARPAAELGLALLHLCQGVAREYERHKSLRNRLDFDDQLHHAYRLLQRDSVRKELSTGLQAVLVDEFQDTDPIQVKIVEALCGEALAAGRLFFVGDYKQSIYRFRGAEPRVFRDVRSALPLEGQLPLSTNFRSQPAILNFVNALFHDAFQDEEYVPLQPQRKQLTKEPAVEFLWTPVEIKRGHIEEARREEARRIARRIKSLIQSGEPIIADTSDGNSTMRPLRLGDVAILFRALSNVRYYEEALRELGLDYYLAGGHAFYAQQEILDVLNLLRAVNSAADEIALAGLLRSPFFSLADETIFWMKESAGSLNGALASAKLPSALSDAETGKWRFAAKTLDDLRQMKDRVPIAKLLNEAVTRTGFAAALCAEFLGQRKLANLQKLIEQARNADQGGILSLDDFIVQLSEFTLRQPKEALAATCPDTANVIRLMTIHFAKGLEFPLVIVPDLDRKERVGGDSAVFDPELGPLVKIPDSKIATGRDLYVARESAEEAEERKRLLYVACTRAADYLILSSSLAGFDKLESDWMKHLAERFDLETGALRSQLPVGYSMPQVGVIDPAGDDNWKPESQSRRPDLLKLVEEAEQLAREDSGEIPQHVGPVPLDRSAERRFSFTELTGALIEDSADGYHDEPELHRTEGTDPRELGRLVHALMERNGHIEDDALDAWCEELARGEVLVDAKGAGRLAAGMIRKFRETPRAERLAKAKKSFREIEFLLAWPPEEGASGRYFRGFIDCLYEDQAGDWRVLDYKTNNISPVQCESTAKKYELQMAVYGLAVEAALKRPPAELVLCFLRPGVEYVLPWNASVRVKAIDKVNQAIERFVSGLVGE